MNWKRILSLTLGLSLLAACGPKPAEPTPAASADPTPTVEVTAAPSSAPEGEEKVQVSMLKGPTGLGAAKLMEEQADSAAMEFTVFAEPTEAVAALTKGSVDIAALPTNLASNLYHKTEGGVELICLNTLGTLYILENGEEIQSLSDLEGRTVYAYGQGANPEYVLNYLLELEGVDSAGVDLQWKSSTDEIAALMAAGEAEVCMLPVPAATTVLMQNEGVRTALDLNRIWEDSDAEGVLTMGCVVARTEFAQANPEAVETFLKEYEASIAYMSDPANLDDAAALAEKHGIVPKAAVAKRALPDANLCFVTGEAMITGIQGYYEVLANANAASIGGSIPDGAFYYGYSK